MSRPAQVEQQIARVKELEAEMLEGNKPPIVEDTVSGTTPNEPVTEPVVVEPPATVSKADYDRLEQRNRTLQGMINAANKQAREESAALQSQMLDLQNRLAQAERAATTPATPPQYVTEADRETYGDTIDTMRRAAREEAEQIAAQREQAYLDRIAQLEQRVGQFQNAVEPTLEEITRSQEQKVHDDFFRDVAQAVPEWEKHNYDPKFIAWLDEEDPVTGATRRQFLFQARNTYDAPRVIRIFQEWERKAAGGQTPAPNTQANLERMVAPGASKGGVTPTQPEKRTWTDTDIRSHFKAVISGEFRGREAEQHAIEADIAAAKREGRYKQS